MMKMMILRELQKLSISMKLVAIMIMINLI